MQFFSSTKCNKYSRKILIFFVKFQTMLRNTKFTLMRREIPPREPRWHTRHVRERKINFSGTVAVQSCPSTVSFPLRVASGATGARVTVGFDSSADYARLRYRYSVQRQHRLAAAAKETINRER